MGTAGGVKRNQSFLETDTFVILSGDALTDIDLSAMYEYHKSKGALATIALKSVEDVSELAVPDTNLSLIVIVLSLIPGIYLKSLRL